MAKILTINVLKVLRELTFQNSTSGPEVTLQVFAGSVAQICRELEEK